MTSPKTHQKDKKEPRFNRQLLNVVHGPYEHGIKIQGTDEDSIKFRMVNAMAKKSNKANISVTLSHKPLLASDMDSQNRDDTCGKKPE